MEQLLIILFILFSIFTSLRERRKRRRAETEQSSRREPVGAPRSDGQLEVEEESTIWSVDPFEVPSARQRASTRTELLEVDPEEEESVRAENEQLLLAKQANQLQEQAQEARRVKHSVSDLVRDRVRQQQEKAVAKPDNWRMNVRKARKAIVYAEILGKPRADRRDDF